MAHAGGRPTKYNKEFHPKLVEALARNGLIDKEIAYKLDISDATLANWKKRHREFLEAIKRGKNDPDDQVEQSLYKRAIGYEYVEVIQEAPKYTKEEIKNGANSGDMITTKAIKKHIAPDVAACFIWLKNRRPEKWRDRHEITGADGEPLAVTIKWV